MSEKDKSKEWRDKAHYCIWSAEIQPHEWIPIAYSVSDKAKHVTTMMCAKCFHEINIAEAFEHRVKL